MGIKGRSFAGAVAIAEQADIDTPNTTPDIWLPALSSGMQTARPGIARGGIFSSPEVQCHQPGLETNTGQAVFESDGIIAGSMKRYMFGDPSSAAHWGTVAAAPTLSAATAGSLADGDYEYRVANVFTETATGDVRIGAASDASATETLSGGGNGDITVSWSNVSPPSGWTLTGTMIYRKIDSGDMVFLHYLDGSGTSWQDDGSNTAGTIIPPEQAYVHTYTPPIANDQLDLKIFTYTQQMDLTKALQFNGCKIQQMAIAVAEDGNSPVQLTFDIIGRNSVKVDNKSPSFTPVCSMLSHQSTVEINGSAVGEVKAMSLNVNNNVQAVYGKDGNPYPRNHNEGMRITTGSLTIGFENYDQWDRMKEGTEFELTNTLRGTPTTENASYRIDANTVARPFAYGASFHMPKCLYDGPAGGQLSEAELMNESLNYMARFSASDGYSIQATVTNRTASYS